MSAKELAAPFGVTVSKAAMIRKMLKISYFDAEWCLPSKVDDNFMLWIVIVDGLLMYARMLHLEMQEACYEKGLIPYIPVYENNDK